jgi:hypothetical protein
MALFSQLGFVACRKLGGGEAIQKTYAVSASTNEAYFQNQAVTLGASGKVKPLKAATTTAPLGVITALYRSSGGKPMPLTFNQPTTGPFLVSGQAGFAQVNVDINQTYIAQFGGTVDESIIGGAVKVSGVGGNTLNGTSNQTLNGTVSTSADNHFQILGFAPVELLISRTSVAAQGLVECKLLRSVFASNPV